MKYSELYRLLESKGWKRANGTNHYKFRNPEFKYFIIVPRHASHEVPNGTLRSILRQAKLVWTSLPTQVGRVLKTFNLLTCVSMIKGYVESAGEDGFSIYASEDIPVWGYGSSLKDAEDDFIKCYHEQAKEIADNSNGEYPSWYSKVPVFTFESSR